MEGKEKQRMVMMRRRVVKRETYEASLSSSDDYHEKQKQVVDCVEEEEEEEEDDDYVESYKRKKIVTRYCCQAERCRADLSDAKPYHRRHKVCEQHSKAQVVLVAGLSQRFCQQCSRFHELSEFDETKRSCRRRLAGHNERRRKNTGESHRLEGSNRKGAGTQLKDMVCGQIDDRRRIKITIQENATYKHFQIT